MTTVEEESVASACACGTERYLHTDMLALDSYNGKRCTLHSFNTAIIE